MPRATNTLSREVFLAFSIASRRLFTDFSLYHSSLRISSRYSESQKTEAKSVIHQRPRKSSICFVPNPSIFIHCFETNISSCPCIFAGQCIFGQKKATFPSSLSVFVEHTGQHDGGYTAFSSHDRASDITETISGMTSPARMINTKSPSRTSFFASSS